MFPRLCMVLLVLLPCLLTGSQAAGCKKTKLGKEYIGSVSTTVSGRKCQAWTSQSPHKHNRTPGNYPDGNLQGAENHCRNPDNEPEGPWCYTTDPGKRWEYCGVPACPGCKTSKMGKEYSGTVSKTASGKTCQAWTSQAPHKHSRTAANYPNGLLEGAENFCRNPDNEPEGPWCYTTDPNSRWEYCDVPVCTECKNSKKGQEYTGSVSKSKSGKNCQAWTAQSPHKHNRTPANYPNGHLNGAKNFCRNPDAEPLGPWCYTTNPNSRWEYCDVPMCTAARCKSTKLGKEYVGTVSVTKSGRKCQAWLAQSPQKHNRTPANYPDGNLVGAENHCRNPDNEPEGPWCYTTDPAKRWEYCDVPKCP